jgi:quercetin dioxygenase-like cupin family protein
MNELQKCDAASLKTQANGGPLWGISSDDLNMTLLSWSGGQGIAPHRNDELDVVWICIEGQARVLVDGAAHELRPGIALLIPKGSERALETENGVRYYSVHRRRRGLMPDVKMKA